MNELDAFDWALNKALGACEEKRLDPPAELPTIECVLCSGWGYFRQDHCHSLSCTHQRYCKCDCARCAYIGCDLCDESGEMLVED